MPTNRHHLLVAAAEILDIGPYDGLTIDALANRLRMSKYTLYKFFESKDQLIEALVEHLCETTNEDLARATVERGTPTEGLAAVLDLLAAYADRIPRALLLQPEKLPKNSRLRLDQVRRKIFLAVVDVMEKGVASGDFQTRYPKPLGAAVAAAAEAAIVAGARDPASKRSEIIRELGPVLTAGFATTAR